MAAVTKVAVAFVSPVGEYMSQRGYANENLEAGDPVVVDGASPSTKWDIAYSKADAEEFCDGVVYRDVLAGGTVEVVEQGEMDGYSGLTPGAAYTVVGGAIDTTAPAAGIRPQFRALNATRIRVSI